LSCCRVIQRVIFFAGVLLAVIGCHTSRENLATFNRHYETGRMDSAASFAAQKISRRDRPRGDDLLWMLQLGAAERFRQQYDESTFWLDLAEGTLRHYALNRNEIADSIAAAVINDTVTPYAGTIYDGIMVNTYKALNFMRQGQEALARVEFNRAMDRQRRAKEEFAEQIQAVRERLEKNQYSRLARRSIENADLRTQLEQTYSSLDEFEAYQDFVNPFSTYLAGVFFAATNDYPKASDLLRQSAGMLPDNPYVLRDFAEVEQALNTGSTLKPTVWVFFENGLGPVKEEVRLDLPLFIATNKVRYFGVALPQLVYRPAAAAKLDMWADGTLYTTEIAADMDRLVQTEFKKEFDGILLRTVLSAIAKAAAQYVLEENNAEAAAIVMAVFHYATTAADVRIWSALPKNFQVARFARPADGWIDISLGALPAQRVQLPDCTHTMVYVKMVSTASRPIIELIPF